jgi:hypothetical protein
MLGVRFVRLEFQVGDVFSPRKAQLRVSCFFHTQPRKLSKLSSNTLCCFAHANARTHIQKILWHEPIRACVSDTPIWHEGTHQAGEEILTCYKPRMTSRIKFALYGFVTPGGNPHDRIEVRSNICFVCGKDNLCKQIELMCPLIAGCCSGCSNTVWKTST